MRILLIEDDSGVADYVARGLRAAGHSVRHLADGREGMVAAASEEFDVIVLDRMLPRVDGMTILRTLRASRNATPVLLLSALGDVDDRVEGLRAGGDDYLRKPFAMAELAARIEVLGKRSVSLAQPSRLSAQDLEMDLHSRVVRRGGKGIALTDREFRILEFLVRHTDRVVTRSMLLEHVWDYHFDPQTNIIDQHVSRLRHKVDSGSRTPLIETVRGSGYIVRSGSSD